MFGALHLEEITGGSFLEVLKSLILNCIPDGGEIIKIVQDFSVLFLILGILAGVFQCFFGYKVRRLWTAILMIAVCGCAGAAVAAWLELPVAAVIGITAGAAVIGGLLGYFVWIIGCFFRPFAVISISVFAAFVINDMHTLGLIIGLAAGLIAGIVSAAFYRVSLILYTSVFGGLLAGACAAELIGLDLWYLPLIIGGVLALAGIIVQLLVNRKAKTAEKAQASADGAAEENGSGQEKEAAERFEEAFAEGKPDAQPSENALGAAGVTAGNGQEEASSGAVFGEEKPENCVPGESAAELAAAAEPENCAEKAPKPEAAGAGQSAAAAEGAVKNADADMGTEGGVCPECGAPHGAGAKFCMQCGHKLIGTFGN